MGTWPYMAPESARGQVAQIDERCDVFGLGAVLCEILTGKPAYNGKDVRRQALDADLTDALARLDSCGADAELVQLARWCLSARLEDRPGNAGVVAQVLASYLASVEQRLRAAELATAEARAKAVHERKRRRLTAALAVSALAIVLLGAGAWLWIDRQQSIHDGEKERTIQIALARATLLRDQGKWQDGLVALKSVQELLGEGDEIQRQVQDLLNDLQTLDRLATLRARKRTKIIGPNGEVEPIKLDPDYAQAFKDYGIDLDELAVEEAAARIRARPALVSLELAMAIDDWALQRKREKPNTDKGWLRLLDVASAADTDPWRIELRDHLRKEGSATVVRDCLLASRQVGAAWLGPMHVLTLETGIAPALRKLAASADAAKLPPQSSLLLGQVLVDASDYEAAIVWLRVAQSRHPTDVWINAALARSLSMDYPDEAIRFYTVAAALHPEFGHTLAHHLRLQRRYKEAIGVYRELIRRQPLEAETYRSLGLLCLHQGRDYHAEGMAAYNEYIRLAKGGNTAWAFMMIGDNLELTGHDEEAIAAYRKAISLKPEAGFQYDRLARVLIKKKRFKEAIDVCSKAIAADQEGAAGHYLILGEAYRDNRQFKEAIAAFQIAIKLQPENYFAYHSLGNLLFDRGKFDEAVIAHKAAIKLSPKTPSYYVSLGNALLSGQKGLNEAIVAFKTAIDLDEDKTETWAYVSMGRALFAQRKFAEGTEAFNKAFKTLDDRSKRAAEILGEHDKERIFDGLKTTRALIYCQFGLVLARHGKHKDAEAACREAVKLRPDLWNTHNSLGTVLLSQGRYKEAEASYREAIQCEANEPLLHHNLGDSLRFQCRHKEAETAYLKAIHHHAEFPEAHASLGLVLAGLGKYKEAEAACREAIRLKANFPEAHAALAVVLVGLGKYQEAEMACREAIRLKVDEPLIHGTLGIALRVQGKLKEAAVAYREAIRLKANFPEAHASLGLVLAGLGKYKEAETACREAIRLKADDAEAHAWLGTALSGQGKYKEAEPVCREAICLKKDFPDAHATLGLSLVGQGKPIEAEKACREAIGLKEDLSIAHNVLGLALMAQGKHKDAERSCRKAVELKKDDPSAHLSLGTVLLARGEHKEAEVEIREAIRLKMDEAGAHASLGSVLSGQGKHKEAETASRKAIQLKKDLPEGHLNLGVALLGLGQHQEAEIAFREAIRLKATDPAAFASLSAALSNQGKFKEAETASREALRLKADLPEANSNLGLALLGQGKHKEAEEACRQGIKLQPDYPNTYLILGFALQNQGNYLEAAKAIHRGDELGSKLKHWGLPSKEWARLADRLVELERRLPEIVSGKAKPASAAEGIEFASLCWNPAKRYHALATRLAAAAFAADPKLAEDIDNQYRYNAACSAAVAAAGRAEDGKKLTDKEKTALRQQSLQWLRADLRLYDKLVQLGEPNTKLIVQQRLAHWQADADFATVRDTEALTRLQQTERDTWNTLWTDVDNLLKRAIAK